MKRSIWKFPFEIQDTFTLKMPLGSQILHVDMQGGVPCLWALVFPEEPLVDEVFLLRGTGHNSEGLDAKLHIGTFLLNGGALVFHLFHQEEPIW